MSSRKPIWNVNYESDFIEQMMNLSITDQANINNTLRELAYQEDPRNVAPYDDCGIDDEDCPYIIQIFPSLPFEFTYKMDLINHRLLLIGCFRFEIKHSFD